MKTPQRWAMTGATGLVGNNLVRLLLQQGREVSVLARKIDGPELKGLDLRVVQGDINDKEALIRCFEGAEIVVHAAAMVQIGASRGAEMAAINVGGTQTVCAALPKGARLLHVSSVDALGFGTLEHPANEKTEGRPEEGGIPYVDTKRAADRVVRQAGIDHVIVHPTFMIGPHDWKPSSGKMLLAIAKGQTLIAPPGTNNFVYIKDVCEAMIAAAEAPSKSNWILGNENLRYIDAWTRMAKVIGARPPIGTFPAWMCQGTSFLTDIPRLLGMEEGDVNAVSTRMGFKEHCFDSSAARRELGLKATPLEHAVQEAWAFFQSRSK